MRLFSSRNRAASSAPLSEAIWIWGKTGFGEELGGRCDDIRQVPTRSAGGGREKNGYVRVGAVALVE